MKILIAPDSFKESLAALDVCYAIKSGFQQVFPKASYDLLPMADGGDGTASVLSYALGGRWRHVMVHDPLMRPIEAKYLLLPNATAVIEIAEACGLHLLTKDERNPLIASSYGAGELIKDAINLGVKRIIIGLGGSATNDAGLGLLMALGMRFFDQTNTALTQGGAQLISLQRIDDTELDADITDITIEVACDVTNPLCGRSGASVVFAPQKGANSAQIKQLDDALLHFAAVCQRQGYKDVKNVAGAGAAGGLGFALMTFCGAALQSGFDTIASAVQLSQRIEDADIVITGEGKLDAQTTMGKVAGQIHQLAKQSHTPVIAICGSVEATHHDDVHSQAVPFDVVMPSIQTLDAHGNIIDNVLKNAYTNIETTALNVAAAIKLGQRLK